MSLSTRPLCTPSLHTLATHPLYTPTILIPSQECDHVHHMVDVVNDHSDGFLDGLLVHARIEVIERLTTLQHLLLAACCLLLAVRHLLLTTH